MDFINEIIKNAKADEATGMDTFEMMLAMLQDNDFEAALFTTPNGRAIIEVYETCLICETSKGYTVVEI